LVFPLISCLGIRIPPALKPFLAAFTAGFEDPDVIPFVRGPPGVQKGGKGQAKNLQAKKEQKEKALPAKKVVNEVKEIKEVVEEKK
jgi:hypothetical protein